MPETDGNGAARKKAKTNQLEMPETDDGSDKEHADILYKYKYFYAKIALEIRPFVIAAHTGDLDGLRRAFAKLDCDIDNPMDIDVSIGGEDKTLLHLTCVHGHLTCAQVKLVDFSDVDYHKFIVDIIYKMNSLEKFDVDRRTPMHYASQRGQIEMVQLFLTHAKEPESVKRMLQTIDKAWNTPLHVAAMFEHVDVIRLLLAHGASPTAKNFFWMTPIQLTRQRDCWIILQEAERAASYGKTAI